MYTYIMERTQIYLSREQAAALDREAKRRGTTRSHLIREAIDQTYVVDPDRDRLLAALRASAGAWKDRRETGAEYVERLRSDGRLARLREWRDAEDAAGDSHDPGAG
ncbi:MAG TPA: CopG family transcriptional regulator [Candidatus Limnocylindria bacterium]|nr:CopG family transcriptional regulator [Candidatus Limnocylindria bacterium]